MRLPEPAAALAAEPVAEIPAEISGRLPAEGPALQGSDGELLRQVLAESPVRTEFAEPGWTAYLSHLVTTLFQWVLNMMISGAEAVFGLVEWAGLFGKIAVWVALGLLAAWLLRFLFERFWPRRESEGETPMITSAVAGGPDEAQAERWRREIDRRLAAGEITEALEAVWWWVAASIFGDDADPAWTSRELAQRAERRELLPSLRHLDRLAFGRVRAQAGDVRGLVERLEGTLA